MPLKASSPKVSILVPWSWRSECVNYCIYRPESKCISICVMEPQGQISRILFLLVSHSDEKHISFVKELIRPLKAQWNMSFLNLNPVSHWKFPTASCSISFQRRVDLSPVMSPTLLAEQALGLNLRLMRWRAAPDLEVSKMAGCKCLIIGVSMTYPH
jgi:hypothetical protein